MPPDRHERCWWFGMGMGMDAPRARRRIGYDAHPAPALYRAGLHRPIQCKRPECLKHSGRMVCINKAKASMACIDRHSGGAGLVNRSWPFSIIGHFIRRLLRAPMHSLLVRLIQWA